MNLTDEQIRKICDSMSVRCDKCQSTSIVGWGKEEVHFPCHVFRSYYKCRLCGFVGYMDVSVNYSVDRYERALKSLYPKEESKGRKRSEKEERSYLN